jgi:hypothetical protein
MHGGIALSERPSRFFIAMELAALGGAVVLAALMAPAADWDLVLLFTLLAFSVTSDVGAVETRAGAKISGSLLALILAMVFMGGTPAAVIGVVTITVGWLRWRDNPHDLLINLVTYAWFPLVGGLAFAAARDATGLTPDNGPFYLLVLGVFALSLLLNFTLIAGYSCYEERSSFLAKTAKVLFPVFA